MLEAIDGVDGVGLGYLSLVGAILHADPAIDAKLVNDPGLAIAHPDAFHGAALEAGGAAHALVPFQLYAVI